MLEDKLHKNFVKAENPAKSDCWYHNMPGKTMHCYGQYQLGILTALFRPSPNKIQAAKQELR
jgi:hypothetical protein